ncbi:DUF1704 domain-containing protein [bacterium]|nr:DUF1704 domain-containing protein [bacterium]
MEKDLTYFAQLDQQLVDCAKEIKVLSNLAWPEELGHKFLASWQSGKPELPQPAYKKHAYPDHLKRLEGIMKAAGDEHPVGHYISQTALSYIRAGRMLECIGQPEFTKLSIELYGRPGEPIGRTEVTNVAAAEHFIKSIDDYSHILKTPEPDADITSEQLATALKDRFGPVFKDHPVDIVIDPDLASKAAASARRVRIRGNTKFTRLDVKQLAEHEGLVHAATMLNGREQPHFKSLGLGSPRTTLTQEGIATFAEFITDAMDVWRLKRIALRIKAVDLALNGANFIDLFKFFLSEGQSEKESFASSARVFRGGDPRGGVAFTKDGVYLEGLIFVHTFLRKAIQANKVHYPTWMFVGRLTLGDIVNLEPFIESGWIKGPLYMPEWLSNRECLAAYLAYASFANRINLSKVTLDDFGELERK